MHSLPNLEQLTADRPDTQDWIKTQEFEYEDLDRLTIIRILAESADISPQTGLRTGTINVHDCVGDDGDIVQRIFSMGLSFDGEEPVLTVTQHGIGNAEQDSARYRR